MFVLTKILYLAKYDSLKLGFSLFRSCLENAFKVSIYSQLWARNSVCLGTEFVRVRVWMRV